MPSEGVKSEPQIDCKQITSRENIFFLLITTNKIVFLQKQFILVLVYIAWLVQTLRPWLHRDVVLNCE